MDATADNQTSVDFNQIKGWKNQRRKSLLQILVTMLYFRSKTKKVTKLDHPQCL